MSNEPIRVLHVIGSMNRGGAETMIMNLYRAIDRNAVQFDFVENCADISAYDSEIECLGGRIYRCPHYNGKNHFQYKKWWKHFFLDHKADYRIVHGHLGSTAAIYLKAAKKQGIYTVAHSHNTLNGVSINNFLYSVYTFPVRFTADFFMACGREAAISRFGKKIANDSGRCAVLNNAIDTSHFVFSPVSGDEIRRQFNIGDRMVFGHVGRFNSQKNHRFLIEIFSKIIEKVPDSFLLLVGDGTLIDEIKALAEQRYVENNVVFAGLQNDVAPFYSAMNVLIFPSLYEGLPVTLVESQTSGLPFLISEFVPPESVLVPELADVVSLNESAETWAERAIVMAQKKRYSRESEVQKCGFDIQQTAAELCDFYKEKACVK